MLGYCVCFYCSEYIPIYGFSFIENQEGGLLPYNLYTFIHIVLTWISATYDSQLRNNAKKMCIHNSNVYRSEECYIENCYEFIAKIGKDIELNAIAMAVLY